MADLTGKTLANGYPNLVTIGATTNDNPTSGTLENGKGNNLTSVTVDGDITIGDKIIHEGDTNTAIRFPSADTVAVETAGQERMRIDSSGNVGIGTTSPALSVYLDKVLTVGSTSGGQQAGIELLGNITNDTVVSALTFNNQASGTADKRIAQISADRDGDNNSASLNFSVWNGVDSPIGAMSIDSSGNVGIGTTTPDVELDVDGEIRASGGILFGTDTAAANALDDYEEGTWTPVYAAQTGSFTTMTMDVQSATYTKIGRQVTVRARIQTDNVDATGASGDLLLSGLPFASASGQDGWSAISVGFVTSWSTAPDSGVVSDDSTDIILRKTNATTDLLVSDLTTGAVANQNQLFLTATYFV